MADLPDLDIPAYMPHMSHDVVNPAGARPESALAVGRLRDLLRDHGFAESSLQVFDIEQRPQIAMEAQVVGVPALVRELPLPRKVLIGDLSQAAAVLALAPPVPLPRQTRGEVLAPGLVLPPPKDNLNQKTVRVLLFGFSLVVRTGLQAILSHPAWVDLIPEALDQDQMLQSLREAEDHGHPIHIVLTEDVRIARLIKTESPATAVLVLSEHIDSAALIDVITAGRSGYLSLQNLSSAELLEGIRNTLSGEVRIKTADLSDAINAVFRTPNRIDAIPPTVEHLSERQIEILNLLSRGDSNKVIAKTLGITENTTKKHVGIIMKKLSAQNRTQVAVIALRIISARAAVTP